MRMYHILQEVEKQLTPELRDTLVRFALAATYEGGMEELDKRKSDAWQIEHMLEIIKEM